MHGSLFTDGGTRGGNPGFSACGFVVMDKEGEVVFEFATLLDGKCSNNVAEYGGLILGLHYCSSAGFRTLDVFTDSKLMAEQMDGLYAVRAEALKPCFVEAKEEEARFEEVSYHWVSRQFNKHADRLVRELLDEFMEQRARKMQNGRA